MALVTYRPTTPSQRALVTIDRSGLWKGRPEKALLDSKSKTAGRNNNGRITVRHIGGGHKQKYRLVDFKRAKMDMPATVERLEHDPNRTAFIALIRYEDGQMAYILAPQRLKVGDKVIASATADILPGNALPLKNIPVGTIVHNVELKPGKGGQMARSAGSYLQIVGKDAGYAMLRMASGEQRLVHESCMATIGAVSNPDHSNTTIGKAGRKRWMGIRPTVRGQVMNPVDHPLGGRTRGGVHPCSPSGVLAKGGKTRSPKKASSKLILRSRHSK